ncbi:MAG TPA: chromosome segregation protein SMC, partial [Flavisolibacter sp.]|nr:chromosome segregation protein SMC [Flavisolibacter sp.]
AGTKESIHFTEQQLVEENNVLTRLTAQLEETRATVDAKRSVLDEKRTALNGFRTTFQQVQRSQFDAEKKVAIGDTSIQNLERAVRQVEEDRATREAQKASIEKDIESTDKELNTRKEALEELQLHHNKTKEQILLTQSGLESLRQQLTDENRKLDAKKNEYDLLKSMIDSMEGYPESIKFLHNNRGWNHAAPILTDIIYVTEEYRAAVENVLEPFLNYYVVNNLAEGLQAVHLLDGAKKGKANFFLLDKVGSVEAENHGTPAGTIPAMSVIEVDEPYRKLAEQLLGNVFIAHDEAALQNSNGAVILERHGRYVKGTYTLKGGSVGWFEGKKIGRAKNLEKLHEEMVLRQGIVADFKTQIAAKHNEVNALNGELKEGAMREAERAIQQQNNQLFALQNRLENLHHAQVQSGNRLGDLHGQLETTKTSVHSIRSELAALNNQLAEHAASMHQAEKDYQTIELGYNEVNTLYNAMNLNVTRQQSKIAALKQELQFKTNGLNDLHQQAAVNTKQLEETTINVTSVEADLKGLLENLHQLMRNKESAELNLNTKDQAYYNLRNAISSKESELRHLTKQKENIEHLLAAVKDKTNELKLSLAGMKERLNVEFRINLEDILDQPRPGNVSTIELQEKADRMKKRLENLGEVNPTAIEAHEEMKKRYDFITEQKDDLVNAKQSLMQTIAEVETTANQKFLETFNRVRENFQHVFQTLFTEDDHCDLVLENPDNLAETAIDIIARPKGKRPSSINQLSGGERTLTATAMLFAIYLIKPAPFCILDEVDAPLDDANVGKFTKMIREFSANSQFIIVTHNKTTMSTVDVIYGVTMQEAGVSRLVPVDFRSLN